MTEYDIRFFGDVLHYNRFLPDLFSKVLYAHRERLLRPLIENAKMYPTAESDLFVKKAITLPPRFGVGVAVCILSTGVEQPNFVCLSPACRVGHHLIICVLFM